MNVTVLNIYGSSKVQLMRTGGVLSTDGVH